jgi:hypothetical protein
LRDKEIYNSVTIAATTETEETKTEDRELETNSDEIVTFRITFKTSKETENLTGRGTTKEDPLNHRTSRAGTPTELLTLTDAWRTTGLGKVIASVINNSRSSKHLDAITYITTAMVSKRRIIYRITLCQQMS